VAGAPLQPYDSVTFAGNAYVFAVEFISGALGVTGPTVVVGDVILGPSSLLTVASTTGGVLNVTGGSLTIEPGAALMVSANASGVILVATASGGISGTFASVTGTNCTQVNAVNYASTTLTVTVTVTPSCGGGLSTGALAGIIEGAVVGGILVAIAIVLVALFCARRHDADANYQIKARELSLLRK
jgi:hypothetical protein